MELDEILEILNKEYSAEAIEFFWLNLDEDSYTKTDEELMKEAGLTKSKYRLLMSDLRFVQMLNDGADAMMYASVAKVKMARKAYALEFSGGADRKAFLERYDDEEDGDAGNGINFIVNMPDVEDSI